MVWINSDSIYQSNCILKCYNIFYSRYIHNSNNIWFSTNLIGCSECILCDGIENTSYAIQNKVYDKAEYFLKKSDLLKRKGLYTSLYLKESVI